MNKTPSDPFATTLADLFAPLAQAMVARGLTLGSATESMKRALLNAVIALEGPDVSDSRISVMTGLHRKDVRRLRSDGPAIAGRRTVNRMALLIGHWFTAPGFQDQAGKPRPLAREADDNGPGFNDLVGQVRLDVAPGTILQALCDQGTVEEDPEGLFHLMANALLPPAGSDELIAAYRATLSAHLTAATHNLLADKDAPHHFDRMAHYSHLSDASITELEEMARAEAQAFLERLNKRALELQGRDAAGKAGGKFAAGVFVLPTPGADKGDSE